ncbi:uncharacterized protein PAC_18632 [Phialocephala subalpina]|uniref:Biotrophy-associated secreted protein 2 n=1 Tax=Phialocephala subalpina TaxID=576137 RepID=A0A1L7XUP1_9HELO|nr:uncharacterized protein PAC_18632 [Phialocephala subalpina]
MHVISLVKQQNVVANSTFPSLPKSALKFGKASTYLVIQSNARRRQQASTFKLPCLQVVIIASAQPPFDPSGGINVGNDVGGQFIGGQCIQDSDCATQCCANPTGICSTVDTSTSLGKTGCGFPSGHGPATTGPSTGPIIDPSGAPNVGNGVGAQFIGGGCLNGADCAGPSGICSGVDASTGFGKTGCGFVSSKRLFKA